MSRKSNLLEEKFNNVKYNSFISGALSPEAKEYWQQGMYSEEEVIALCSELHVDHLHSNF